MTTAQSLINQSLRLINVPGRGGRLSAAATAEALEALQLLLAAKASSSAFQPGIRRHFFALDPNKAIYTYGPGGDFDTGDFNDPVPIRVEDAYIRANATITDLNKITNGSFDGSQGAGLTTPTNMDGWLPIVDNPSTQWQNDNDFAVTGSPPTVGASNAPSATIFLTIGQSYTFSYDFVYALPKPSFTSSGRILAFVETSDSLSPGTIYESYLPDATGSFSHEFVAPVSSPFLHLISFGTSGDLFYRIDNIRLYETGQDRKTLSDGSDYTVNIIDSLTYNRKFTKGVAGRPYELLFSRQFPLAEIRFDNSPAAGDILVMDVVVDPNDAVTTPGAELRVHKQSLRYLKYKLADEVAGDYGKQLSPRQLMSLNEARSDMAASNWRPKGLRADRALQRRPTFDINRGDP